MVWAFAMANQSDTPLFVALAKVAEQLADDFNSQNLANVAWAFAGQLDVPLSVALSRAAKLCVGNFNSQNLTNMAWAFATAG